MTIGSQILNKINDMKKETFFAFVIIRTKTGHFVKMVEGKEEDAFSLTGYLLGKQAQEDFEKWKRTKP